MKERQQLPSPGYIRSWASSLMSLLQEAWSRRHKWNSRLITSLATILILLIGRSEWCIGQQCDKPSVPRLRDLGKQQIPRIVWQTWKVSNLSTHAAANRARFELMNPAYEHRLVNDSAAAAFIATQFRGRIADAYFSINPNFGAARADLWRYCVLYKYGGWYMDLDMTCDIPLKHLYAPSDWLVHSYEHARLPQRPPPSLRCVADQWFDQIAPLFDIEAIRRSGFEPFPVAQNMIAVVPRHPIIATVIKKVVHALENLDESQCRLPLWGVAQTSRERERNHNWCWMRTIWLTGPLALTIAFHNYTHNLDPHLAHVTNVGNRRVLDFRNAPLRKACFTNRRVNEEMNANTLKYTNFPDKTPFKVE